VEGYIFSHKYQVTTQAVKAIAPKEGALKEKVFYIITIYISTRIMSKDEKKGLENSTTI
jgi:hypothetical protein